MQGRGERKVSGGDCLRQPVEVLGFCLHIGRGICCVQIPVYMFRTAIDLCFPTQSVTWDAMAV